jgi:hypothetical protein
MNYYVITGTSFISEGKLTSDADSGKYLYVVAAEYKGVGNSRSRLSTKTAIPRPIPSARTTRSLTLWQTALRIRMSAVFLDITYNHDGDGGSTPVVFHPCKVFGYTVNPTARSPS